MYNMTEYIIEGVRPDTLVSIVQYAQNGRPVGHFLTCVLENDLMGAMSRADLHNRRTLYAITCFIQNQIPGNCWGRKGIVAEWCAKKAEEREKLAKKNE